MERRHLEVERLPLLLIQLVQREGDSRQESGGRHLVGVVGCWGSSR